MTKLTTERLEYYAALPTKPSERKAIFMYEVRCMARQLLAYEQAAKNEAALPEALKYAEIYGRAFICVDRSGSVHAVDPSQITLTILNESAPAQPVSEPYKLKDAVEDIRNSGVEIDADKIKSERDALNSPVIPDGWKLVPIEPTAAMFHAFNDCDYGRKSMRERYIQMIEAAPAQESE